MAPRAERRALAVLAALALAALAALATLGCRRAHDAAAPPLAVPRSSIAIKLDGEWDEPDWSKRALRGQFVGFDGKLARPSSEIRMLYDDRYLYVGLYAADENIQSYADAFALHAGDLIVRVDATGTVTPPVAGLVVGVDRDGTLDDPHNFDEEWVLELAIPRARAGGPVFDVDASRCDTTKDGIARCGSWSGRVLIR